MADPTNRGAAFLQAIYDALNSAGRGTYPLFSPYGAGYQQMAQPTRGAFNAVGNAGYSLFSPYGAANRAMGQSMFQGAQGLGNALINSPANVQWWAQPANAPQNTLAGSATAGLAPNETLFRPPAMPTLPSYAGAAAPLVGAVPPNQGFQTPPTSDYFNPAAALGTADTQRAEQNDGRFGVGGGVGQPTKQTTPTGKAGTGAGTGGAPKQPQAETWVDQNGYKRHKDPKIDYSYRRLDGELGQGFTDQFIARMGKDPISWYADQYKARYPGWDLPDARGDAAREKLMGFAAYAAESDAKLLPNAIAEWQQKHGNTPIPQSQWETWSRIALSTGGDGLNAGVGESRYGVY